MNFLNVISVVLIPLGIFFIEFFVKYLRGNKVVFRITNETSVFHIPEKFKDENPFKFKDKPIRQFLIYEIDIINEGFTHIENFEITMELKSIERANVLYIITDDILEKTELVEKSGENQIYLIKRPFINTKLIGEDEKISLQILTDTRIRIIPKGGGKGWKLAFIKSIDEKIRNIKMRTFAMFVLIFSILALYYVAIDSIPKGDWKGLAIVPVAIYFLIIIYLNYVISKF